MVRLTVVGGGRMGEALLAGLLSASWGEADELAVVESLAPRREELARRFPGLTVTSEPLASAGAVLAVKPGQVADAARAVAAAGVDRVLSIAAGVSLARLELAIGDRVPIIRAMPNTPALVGAGAAAVAASPAAGEDDLAWAEGILASVGTVVRVPEPLLDAVTGLSGSGPAYVFLVVESLIEAGVLAGLPRDVSHALAVQTLVGAGQLLAETGRPPGELRADVTSPGGTTAAGLQALEDRGVRAAFLAAVQAATARSRQLDI